MIEVNREYFRQLDSEQFRAVWKTFLSLAPGLHPDDYDAQDSGWHDNQVLEAIGAEAWDRLEAGELSDQEFYDWEAHRTLVNEAIRQK